MPILKNGSQPYPTKTNSAVEMLPTVVAPTAKTLSLDRLSHFFEQACDRQPDNVAVLCGSSQLTYLELDRQANRLAHLLISAGVVEGQTIGILLERSLNSYIALLAVLKAGAVFVPLDPSFPADRLTFIAEDAGLRFLITTSTLHDRTTTLPCTVLNLDQMTRQLADQSETRPQLHPTSTPLCYIIYTSGTTGRPKGVAVSHTNITNFLRVVTPIYQVRPDDRVYQGMTMAFDFSFEEIWPTWIAGATLVAGPTDSRRLGNGLTEFLIDHKITVFYCVPTLLATIDRDIPSLRALLVGGEACPADLVRRWSRPGRRMLNTYGPTEATVTATWCELLPDRPVTIGSPLPTYSIYILDEQGNPVEEGTCGEICIGGPGVAIGYLNRPDLTRDRFIANPLHHEHAPRLYRTGDLGRFTPSGEIEYLGRIDTQVKIRGYRIELGEIEEVLREDSAVEYAVVKPLEVNGIAQDLVAYLTLRSQKDAISLNDLRERLASSLRLRLPFYMVPSFIEVLEEFPLLAADKVDRSALPRPTSPRLGASSIPYIAPTTPIESLLAEVWGQILGREHPSVEEDFFRDLGGHSLAAALVISRLRQDHSLQRLGIGDLYAHPTIRRLAQFVDISASHSDDGQLQTMAPLKHSNLRVLGNGVIQLGMLYSIFLLMSVPAAGLSWAMDSAWRLLWLSIAEVIWLSIVSFLLPVITCRTLLSKVQPGIYPLWGSTYLRWWFCRRTLAFSPIILLAGSPLLPFYLRLLGAKVGHNCHLATAKISLPLYTEIGSNTSIGYAVQLQPGCVEGGRLHLSPIRIGNGVFLGTNSVILAGASIGDHASLDEQSLVPVDHTIPANEHWGGSPCKHLTSISPLLREMAARGTYHRWPIRVLAGFVCGMLLLTLLPWIMMTPSMALVSDVALDYGLWWGIASTILAGPLFVLFTCFLVFVGKRAVMPTIRAGLYPIRSGFGLRKWISDQLMAMSLGLTNTLYATLYLIPFLRLLGARIGKWSEVSTVAHIDPDLLRLEGESFVADIAVVGPAVFHCGNISLAPTTVGHRSFIGNGALVPHSSQIGNDSLIGVYSVPPARNVDPGTSWLGSPAIYLPRRQESLPFEDELTYRPRRSLVAWRLFIEYFRVTFPATLLLLMTLGALQVMFCLATFLSPVTLPFLTPLIEIGFGGVMTLVVALLKWTIIGRYRPRMEPLWSLFVRRSELITGLYEALAVPTFVGLLTGTPWIAPVLRLFGAKIGHRVWLDTTYITEFDLVEIQDDASIGENTSLQTHLFEDRVMKMSTVKVGEASSIGSRSVVLYDSEVGANASLDALSLVMKGETLPAGSHWRGIPSAPQSASHHKKPLISAVDTTTRKQPVPTTLQRRG